MPTSHWFRFFTYAVYALAFFSLGIYVHTALTKPAATPCWQSPRGPVGAPTVATSPDRGGADSPFVQVAEQVTPSVVNISTVSSGKGRTPYELFRPFGNDPSSGISLTGSSRGRRSRRQQTSLGSGLIIDKSGLILTNNHVIKDADEITVRFANKQEFKGKVVGTDA